MPYLGYNQFGVSQTIIHVCQYRWYVVSIHVVCVHVYCAVKSTVLTYKQVLTKNVFLVLSTLCVLQFDIIFTQNIVSEVRLSFNPGNDDITISHSVTCPP